MIASIILKSVHYSEANQDFNGIRSPRQSARLHGPVQEVSVEEYVVGASGEPEALLKSERTLYSEQGNRIHHERDSIRLGEHDPGISGSTGRTTRLDTGLSLNEFGFRLLPLDRRALNPTCVRYAFEIFNLHRHEAFYYDKRGALAARSVHSDFSEGNRRYLSINRYNPQGGRTGSEVTVINPRGDIEEQIHRNSEGNIILHWIYSYDRRGNLLEMTSLDDEGKPYRKVTYSYVYDEQGNWIKRTAYGFVTEAGVESAFIPTMITKRKITYYSSR